MGTQGSQSDVSGLNLLFGFVGIKKKINSLVYKVGNFVKVVISMFVPNILYVYFCAVSNNLLVSFAGKM